MSYIGSDAQGLISNINGGTIENATLASSVGLDTVHPSSVFYLNSTHTGNARIDDWVLETGTGVSGQGSSVAFNDTSDYFYFPVTGVYVFYYSLRTFTGGTVTDNQINVKAVISNDQGTTAHHTFLSTNSFNEDAINTGDAYYSITGSVLVNVETAGDTTSSTVVYLEAASFSGQINNSSSTTKETWCYFYRISNT